MNELTKEQYLALRLSNSFLAIAYYYYREHAKAKGIATIIGRDLFETTFRMFPNHSQGIEVATQYYDGKFDLIAVLDSAGNTIAIK